MVPTCRTKSQTTHSSLTDGVAKRSRLRTCPMYQFHNLRARQGPESQLQRYKAFASGHLMMVIRGSGSTTVASTSPVQPSFKKLSTPCGDSTPNRTSDTLTSKMFRMRNLAGDQNLLKANGSPAVGLQELIAPVHVEFYAENWASIGAKLQRYEHIAEITSIDPAVLIRAQAIDAFSAAEHLSWAAHRNATREEDEAYALLGLFDINMSLLYGEGREKAFIRLQEAIYNSTTDHSMFLFHQSQHRDAQPLLADSPTRFCERLDCQSCLLQNVPSSLRYGNILASNRWQTQVHESIMTTVTKSRNEMSTMLPLLLYKNVLDKLEYFDNFQDDARTDVTHVAVLNHATGQHPEGALCSLLSRHSDTDACIRLQILPAILHDLRDLGARIQRTKLLVCERLGNQDVTNRMDTMFSVKSDLFHFERWRVNGSQSILSAQTGQDSELWIQTKSPTSFVRLGQISCRLSSPQPLQSLLTIRLAQIYGIWSITEVYEPKPGKRERKVRTLFASIVPVDRCSIQSLYGKTLIIRLRRLPSSARALEEVCGSMYRYQISID